MRIAIVGTGISGMLAAYRLHRDHAITVFEARDRIGGHTHTVEAHGQQVDTGFIVCNDRTYPNFLRLLDELGVATQPSSMSFSVKCEKTGLEYNGTTLNTLFAQRRNLFRPSFHRMIREILRFNREARADADGTLRELLAEGGYGREFVDHYLVPMGAAIWSASPRGFLDIPARFFIRFFQNHGMLSVNDRPTWRVVTGGSSRYAEALTRPYRDRIRLGHPVHAIRRHPTHVEILTPHGRESFDEVVIAAHSDQALKMLVDPSDDERAILGAIPYRKNDVVLHTDASLLPRKRLAWAAWNYHLLGGETERVAVTYNMNILQSLRSREPFLVTLNRTADIDPRKVLRRMTYSHPVFTTAGVAAQERWSAISGHRRTHYCGAYWGYGFHEDGVKSALRVCETIGAPACA